MAAKTPAYTLKKTHYFFCLFYIYFMIAKGKPYNTGYAYYWHSGGGGACGTHNEMMCLCCTRGAVICAGWVIYCCLQGSAVLLYTSFLVLYQPN